MIIANGYIEVLQKSDENGIDPETGYPITENADTWGDKVPCQWQQTSYNAQAATRNEPYTQKSYTILIDGLAFEGEQLRLTDEDGSEMGEFAVIAVERLAAVLQTKISV